VGKLSLRKERVAQQPLRRSAAVSSAPCTAAPSTTHVEEAYLRPSEGACHSAEPGSVVVVVVVVVVSWTNPFFRSWLLHHRLSSESPPQYIESPPQSIESPPQSSEFPSVSSPNQLSILDFTGVGVDVT
jgi:hypothetical protein